MKKYYTLKNVFHFLLIIPALLTGTSNANAALQKGDLAVIGMNAVADQTSATARSFAVVALSKIAADEIIKITDRGWIVGTPSSFTTGTAFDGTLQWELSKEVPAGTVIIFKIDIPSATSKTVSATTGNGTALPSGDKLTLSGWTNSGVVSLPWNNATGDQLLIYQGNDTNPSFIFAFNNLRTTAMSNLGDNNWYYDPTGVSGSVALTTGPIYSELPPGMEDYSVAIVTHSTLSKRYPNEMYDPGIEVGTKASWLADIREIGNWIHPVDVNTPHDFGLGFGADNVTQFEMEQVLPVTLISYSVKADGMAAKLEWSTAIEKDNGHYEIEHATDAKNFKVIGVVEVGGSSSVKQNYVWYDRSPANATNYYRLVQVDVDGKVTRYAMKSLNFSVLVAPYPNPSMEKVTISFSKKTEALELTDVNGKLLRTIAIKENETTITIPVSELLPGTYFIRSLTASGSVSSRFIKL